MVQEFYYEVAGTSIQTGMVIAHQTFGDMMRFNPHYHAIILEGGFDNEGTFVSIPFAGLHKMTQYFRRKVIWLFVERELINEEFARNLLSWKHSGFSIDNSVHILDRKSRESIGQYIARPPLSLKKITYESFKGRVLFHTTYSDYFKENLHMFDALDFLAELTQHIPPKGLQLIRRYGLYSSRIKGRWHDMPYIIDRAPAGWTAENTESEGSDAPADFVPFSDAESIDSQTYKRAWAQLLAKVYEVDPFVCPKCGSEMKVIAVIQEPDEIKRILRHLVKVGRSPPGLDPASLN